MHNSEIFPKRRSFRFVRRKITHFTIETDASRAFVATSTGLAVRPYLLYNFSCASYTFCRIWSIFEMWGFRGLRIFFFYYIISVSKHVFSGSPELRPKQNWLYSSSMTTIYSSSMTTIYSSSMTTIYSSSIWLRCTRVLWLRSTRCEISDCAYDVLVRQSRLSDHYIVTYWNLHALNICKISKPRNLKLWNKSVTMALQLCAQLVFSVFNW